MQTNFSLRKAWDDLFSEKKYIWQLLTITVIYICLEFLGNVYQIKGPKFLASIILGGYMSLLAYNIINAKEKVLENILNNSEMNKFFLWVGLKTAIIESLYELCFFIPAFPLGFYLGLNFHLNAALATIIVMLTLSPLLFYITIFPTITFAQNLKFTDAFNFKKAANTIKFAWKDYLLCFAIMFVIFFGIFIFCFSIFYVISLIQNNVININLIIARFLNLKWAYFSLKLPQNSIIMSFANVISSYFATHIVAQVYKYTLKEKNKVENENIIESSYTNENKEKSMEIDFSPKKVWNDLAESKESLKYLVTIGIVLIILGIVDVFLKVKIFSAIGSLILGGYFILMVNNIIHDRKQILEDLGHSEDENRSLGLIILKTIGIGIVYGFALIIAGVILFLLFSKILMLNLTQSIIALIIFLLPLIILVSFSNLLFAENLRFGDAFNLRKAINSFKIAWGKYLTIFFLNILLAVLVIIILMLLAFPIGIMITLLLKSYPSLIITKEVSRLSGGIVGSTIGQLGGVIISYWYMNAVAQVYKYSLTKMNKGEVL